MAALRNKIISYHGSTVGNQSFRLVCLVLSLFLVNSFVLLNSVLSQSISYIHHTVKTGLPSNLIYCGHQDLSGMIWFGTDKGLAKYDNHRFRTFGLYDGLPDPEVINIFEDRKKRLWLSCFRKTLCYIKNDKVYNVDNTPFLNQVEVPYGICNLFEDSQNRIYVSNTTYDAYQIDKDTIEIIEFPSSIVHFQSIEENLLALGSGYIFSYSHSKEIKTLFDFVSELNGIPKYVGVATSGNKILYSFLESLILLELVGDKCLIVQKLSGITGRISVDNSGRFWVCSPKIGAICFDNPHKNLSNPKVFLPGKKITYMFEDRQGTFWFCTLDDGIYGLPQNAPINYFKKDGLPSENLSAIARDKRGRILFGDDEGNLNVLEQGKHSLLQFGSVDGYNRILDILPLDSSRTCVLTDEGVYLLQGKKRAKLPVQGSPKVMLQDGKNLWCGTSARLYKLSWDGLQVEKEYTLRVTALGQDDLGTIWVGGIDGLYSTTDSLTVNWGSRFPELQSKVIAIENGRNETLWVVTPELGLLQLKVRNGQVQTVLEVNKLLPKPIENIHAVFREPNGRLWLSTNRGIVGIDTDNWDLVLYNHNDGLANDDVRDITVFEDTLWAATTTGLTRMILTPLSTTGDFASLITSVRYQQHDSLCQTYMVDNPSVNRTTTLPQDASLVEIDLAGLDYRSRGNLNFDCIITEVLPPLRWLTTENLFTWIRSGFQGMTDTARIYKSSLDFGVRMPSGKYDLQVIALTQNGVRSAIPGSWSFVMPAPWYSTFWFSLSIWTVIAGGALWLFKTRLKLKEMMSTVLQLKLIALQAQINPHFIGNSINAIQRFFYPPSPTKASAYNATFSQLLRKTLDYSEQTFLPFSKEVKYHQDYLELARQRYGDQKFKYTIKGVADISPTLLFPALFLQPILENATIHGSATEGPSVLSVIYEQRGDLLYCTVTDNGPGVLAKKREQSRQKKQTHQSKGLQMLQQKADMLNQLFDLDLKMSIADRSEQIPKEQGTLVIVSFNTKKADRARKRQAKIERHQKSVLRMSKK